MPLTGLSVEHAIKLDEDSSIDPLTDEDIAACLDVGVLHGAMVPMGTFFAQSLAGLKLHAHYEKKVGHLSWQDGDNRAAEEGFASINRRIEVAVQALALTTPHKVVAAGQVTLTEKPGFQGGFSFSPGQLPQNQGLPHALTVGEQSDLQDFWTLLSSNALTANRALDLAVRRISFSRERLREEDSLIDLMIASEAFYLEGTKDELKYRLAGPSGLLEQDRGLDSS